MSCFCVGGKSRASTVGLNFVLRSRSNICGSCKCEERREVNIKLWPTRLLKGVEVFSSLN